VGQPSGEHVIRPFRGMGAQCGYCPISHLFRFPSRSECGLSRSRLGLDGGETAGTSMQYACGSVQVKLEGSSSLLSKHLELAS